MATFEYKFALAWVLAAAVANTGAHAQGTSDRDGASTPGKVLTLRVPSKGIQPQVVMDAEGVVHMIYFGGEPAAGDVYYVRAEHGHFSQPRRVNSQPGSAIALGNIRGAHLAVGKKGRVHIAWMGSGKAETKGPGHAAPMLYTRSNDAGTAFEPERNLIQSAWGLDGGGSVGADDRGNVYVAWHAPEPGKRGEGQRCVWVARSADEGKTFADEKKAFAEPTGACGCCGMRAFVDPKGALYLLFRSAQEHVHRDMYALIAPHAGDSFQGVKLHEWNTGSCPMSTAAFADSPRGVLAAWETEGQVYFRRIVPADDKASPAVAAPGTASDRKHPVLAVNARGKVLMAWTEGMGWNRGGTVAWQVFDEEGRPSAERGRSAGVPTWSLVAVFPRPDGGFTVVY